MMLDEVTGLGDAARAIRGGFRARLDAVAGDAWRALAATGKLHPEARPPSLAVPETFAEWLSHALALGDGGQLARHYLDYMPRMRVEQLGTRAHPNATLFHAPLDWARLPRLSSAIERIFALVGPALGASPAAFREARPTLGALYERAYYGRFMPLLYGYPADLRAIARALDGGADLHAVVDGRLAAPLTHELAHLAPGRAAILPPYVDECLAAYLGRRALPETAWPADGGEDSLYGAPWLAQVGQALARVAPSVLRAHAGLAPWAEALPPGLGDALPRLGWAEYRVTRDAHFLSSNYRPMPWIKLFYLAAAGAPLDGVTLDALDAAPWPQIAVPVEDDADREILADALRAMCVDNFQVDYAYRVRRRPPRAPIDVDCATCRVSTVGGPCDPHGLQYLFPPSTAARLRAAGIAGYTITLRSLDALDEVAAAVLDGCPRATDAYVLETR